MEPFTIAISAAASHVLQLIDWKDVLKHFAGDAVHEGAKDIFNYLKPGDREKLGCAASGGAGVGAGLEGRS